MTAMSLNGRPTAPHTWDNWSAPGLLGIIRRDLEVCLAARAGRCFRTVPRGEFDPQFGYPVRYHRVTQTEDGCEVARDGVCYSLSGRSGEQPPVPTRSSPVPAPGFERVSG